MDNLPPKPRPHGYWADGSAGYSDAELDAYVAALLTTSDDAWRRAVMDLIEEFVPEEGRSAALERLGLLVGERILARGRRPRST